MLKFDILPLLKLKGAKSKAAFLQSRGLSKGKAQHVVKKDVKQIFISDIEKLCRIFNCTPNDLFAFEESTANPLPENSALKKLIRPSAINMHDLVSDLSVEDANKLISKFAELKKSSLN